jgi:hypothetical protein
MRYAPIAERSESEGEVTAEVMFCPVCGAANFFGAERCASSVCVARFTYHEGGRVTAACCDCGGELDDQGRCLNPTCSTVMPAIGVGS